MPQDTMDKIVSLAKRRGFINQSAEIYGGAGALWDFGPNGLRLKNNIKALWRQRFVEGRDDVLEIESTTLTKRDILAASGHEEGFNDPLVECKICQQRFRADQDLPKKGLNPRPGPTPAESEHFHQFSRPKQFNLMFKTNLGPIEDQSSVIYLRPETAQGMFVNFKTIYDTMRQKIPFGLAQVGKSFRNEITHGNFVFRSREFEIAEIEYFVKPGTDEEWFDRWISEWKKFLFDMGLKKENLRRYAHPKESLAHYSKGTVDIEYKFPFGWSELAGIANRTDYDLKAHEKHSGKDLKVFDEETKEKYLPYVIEPTLGVERLMLALLVDSYDTIKSQISNLKSQNEETDEYVLRLNPKIAPVKVAVFPLVNKDKLPTIARKIYQELKKHWYVEYDDSGSIGRRYRRQDEIGTPWCVTVDFDTIIDNSVTIRDRDTMKQERTKIHEIKKFIAAKLED